MEFSGVLDEQIPYTFSPACLQNKSGAQAGGTLYTQSLIEIHYDVHIFSQTFCILSHTFMSGVYTIIWAWHHQTSGLIESNRQSCPSPEIIFEIQN